MANIVVYVFSHHFYERVICNASINFSSRHKHHEPRIKSSSEVTATVYQLQVAIHTHTKRGFAHRDRLSTNERNHEIQSILSRKVPSDEEDSGFEKPTDVDRRDVSNCFPPFNEAVLIDCTES